MANAKEISPILGNKQALDGGAMFGNVPKAMWQKWIAVDQQNQVQLATRAMLVQDGNKNILFETGIGAFFEPKLKQRFGVIEQEHVLLESLAKVGLTHADIDVVVLSHLHFDHAGGLLSVWQENQPHQLLFPKASYIISEQAYQRALHPHARDKASFIPELMQLLASSGRVHCVSDMHCELLGQDYTFHYSDGHTPGLLMTQVDTDTDSVLFVSDLIPGAPWVHLPVTMGYDRNAELVIDEKQKMLDYVQKNNIKLFFTHDNDLAMANISCDERGRYQVVKSA